MKTGRQTPGVSDYELSAELRDQFGGLKELWQNHVDAINNLASDLSAGIGDTAKNRDGMATLVITVSNPPTQAEAQAIANKVDELILALHRS